MAGPTPRNDTWHGLTWVNPVGSILIGVARPAYGIYLARGADVELHRDVAALAIDAAAAGVPVAERRAWAAQQPLSRAARERIAWRDNARLLEARSWQQTDPDPDREPQPRDQIRVAWPASK